jgi:hypothetical protein
MKDNYNKMFNQNRKSDNQNQELNMTASPISVETDNTNGTKIVRVHELPADTNTDNSRETSPETTTPKVKTGIVKNCILVNLREKPTKGSNSVKVLKVGDPLIVDEILTGWVHVHTSDGIEGYIMIDYVKVDQ